MDRHRQIEHKLKAHFFFVLFYDEDGPIRLSVLRENIVCF